MTRRIACLLAALPALLLLCSLASAQENQAALDAARKWVNLIDEGKYGKSWEEAAPIFQESISQQNWVKSLEMVRTPLGNVLSRNLRNAAETTSLPGAPKGEYLVMEFGTSFQNKDAAIETVTVSRVGGNWKVDGYYIR